MREVDYPGIKLDFFIPASSGRLVLIPLFSNLVKCGFPSPAEGYEEVRLDLNELVIRNPLATFFVRVQGPSMEGARIFDGSILVVDRSLKPTEKSNCLCFVNGEFTVKKVKRTGEKIYLVASSRGFPDMEVSKYSDFQIWGVVTKVITDPV